MDHGFLFRPIVMDGWSSTRQSTQLAKLLISHISRASV